MMGHLNCLGPKRWLVMLLEVVDVVERQRRSPRRRDDLS